MNNLSTCLLVTVGVGIVLGIVFVGISRNVSKQQRPQIRHNASDYIETLERGVLDGCHYSIFLHKPTGKKIFAYNHGMIYLPEPNTENADTNHIK